MLERFFDVPAQAEGAVLVPVAGGSIAPNSSRETTLMSRWAMSVACLNRRFLLSWRSGPLSPFPEPFKKRTKSARKGR
jgi:hypothetical protein